MLPEGKLLKRAIISHRPSNNLTSTAGSPACQHLIQAKCNQFLLDRMCALKSSSFWRGYNLPKWNPWHLQRNHQCIRKPIRCTYCSSNRRRRAKTQDSIRLHRPPWVPPFCPRKSDSVVTCPANDAHQVRLQSQAVRHVAPTPPILRLEWLFGACKSSDLTGIEKLIEVGLLRARLPAWSWHASET